MKSIILCCNYNEEKTGNLERCLKSLQQNKLENTIIGIIDNGSKDNSINLISDYVKNKTVDVCIQSLKNLGKPKALNSLFKYMLGAYEIRKDDLCIHLDSDIKIYNNCSSVVSLNNSIISERLTIKIIVTTPSEGTVCMIAFEPFTLASVVVVFSGQVMKSLSPFFVFDDTVPLSSGIVTLIVVILPDSRGIATSLAIDVPFTYIVNLSLTGATAR